jgi:hypothetical protein
MSEGEVDAGAEHLGLGATDEPAGEFFAALDEPLPERPWCGRGTSPVGAFTPNWPSIVSIW